MNLNTLLSKIANFHIHFQFLLLTYVTYGTFVQKFRTFSQSCFICELIDRSGNQSIYFYTFIDINLRLESRLLQVRLTVLSTHMKIKIFASPSNALIKL